MKNKNLHVRLPEELLKEFNRIVNERNVNRSELVRRWIEKYVKEAQEK